MVAALLTTALTIATVVGSAGQDPAVSVERGLPTSVLLVERGRRRRDPRHRPGRCTRRHPLVSAGLAAVAAGQLLPVWAGWAWLPNGVRAAVLAAAPLAVGGSAQVALRWQARPVRSALLGAVWLLTGSAGLVHLVGYNPFADPSCLRTCDNFAPAARNVLSTHAAVVTAGLLAGAGALVAALAVWRSWPRPPWPVWAARARGAGDPRRAGDRDLDSLGQSGAVRHHGGARAVGHDGPARRGRRRRRRPGHAHTSRRRPARHPPLGPRVGLRDLGGAIRAVHFAVPGEGRWVDSAGHDVADVRRRRQVRRSGR